MRTSSSALFLLASTLTLLGGCDDLAGQGFDDSGDDDLDFRCVGTGCGVGGIGNTSKIGDHPLSNLTKIFNADALNQTASVRIEGGTAYTIWGTKLTITEIAVDDDGELRLKLGTAGWIAGTQVKDALFYLYVDPIDPKEATIAGQMRIADAKCEPGQMDPTMSICRYQFVTNVKPADPDLYPMHEKFFGWYHTCPDDDELSQLGPDYKFSSVLSPNASLQYSKATGPRIDLDSRYFINGCLNGAVSKGQFRLNAFYDDLAYRGLDPSQRSAMLLMWMAWHADATRTVPGRRISPHDPIGGLFTWNSLPNWDIEGGYGETGATCRGGSLESGIHRQWIDPVTTLIGWADLPHCDASNLDDYAVLGVRVQADL